MKALLIAAVACVLLSGCATQRFDINKPIGPAGEPTLDTSQAFFIEGLGQESLIDGYTFEDFEALPSKKAADAT